MFLKTYKSAIISGILLGASYPSYPFIHLEILAWIGMIPFLLDIKNETHFRTFFSKSYVLMFTLTAVAVWWISISTVIGGILTLFAQSVFMTIPLIVFFYLKKWVKWPFALLALPFIWTAWEWIYLDMDISFGWLTIANSQSNLIWLVQYVDLFGAWAISFWLILFNALGVLLYEKHQANFKTSKFARDVSFLLGLMVLPALLYSIYCFSSENNEKKETLKVTVVQPNIDPFEKWKTMTRKDILVRHMQLTDSAVVNSHPDMVLWPETAIPYFILFDNAKFYRNWLFRKVEQWHTPLLTGFSDAVYYQDSTEAQAGAKYDKFRRQYYDTFNSSLFMAPGLKWPQVYHKMKLVPFAERVPYMEHVPFLSFATVKLAGISSWGRGQEMTLFSFKPKNQDTVKVCGLICYESIYPGFIAEFVRNGANFLTIITNDGWFSKSYGPYQHAAFARLRCIETRRSMARSANTGISFFIDSFGQAYGEIPWWQALTTTQTLELSSDLSFYVRHIDLFPKICLGASVIIIALALGMKLMGKSNEEKT